jgi:serine/threonine protein kinase
MAAPTAGAIVGGKYRLVRRIGAGGMGEVWVAVNRSTGAEVAVKMVSGAGVRDDAAARFRHEARLGAMLSHRGLVRIFDLVDEVGEVEGRAGGGLVLVMELLRGETLERHLKRRGPLPSREALAIAVRLLSALAHAHASGIVHRDVTPANVFLSVDPDGHVTPKLLDFGIAKVPAGNLHTLDGRALGTPRYMAPERIRNEAVLDGRSDLFSVGVVLYEMLTGACPFAAASPAASLAAVLEVDVDPDPRIEPRVWMELRRALAKRPYERPASAEAMAEGLLTAAGETETQLGDALRSAPVSSEPSSADAALGEPTRTVGGHSLGAASTQTRRRARGIAWATGIVVVATALGGWWAMAPRSATPASTAAPSQAPLRSPAQPSPVATSISPATEGSTATTPVPSLLASSIATPASSAPPANASPTVPTPRPNRPRRVRPVATTPGF